MLKIDRVMSKAPSLTIESFKEIIITAKTSLQRTIKNELNFEKSHSSSKPEYKVLNLLLSVNFE